MEPRFFKRGNYHRKDQLGAGHVRASMEPRFFKRGNFAVAGKDKTIQVLQWNHVFSNVEMRKKRT